MTTRRAKLHAVLVDASHKGLSAGDLVIQLESWTSNGGSGLESFVNDAYSSIGSSTTTNSTAKEVKDLLNQAIAKLGI